jgi:succinate dehydrogenase/fumarate reductase cytochrome b subunit (b558 family)
MSVAASGAGSRASFVLRRAHSLAGVVPLGIFLVEHLWTNASALYGRASFDAAVEQIQRLPGLVWLEAIGIGLPLTFHALYGIAIARRARPNAVHYPFTANWLFLLQRASGIVAFVFVLAHLWQFRFAKARGTLDASQMYAAISETFARPALFALYLLGITATVFHFANGLRTAGETWGLTATDRARKLAAGLSLTVGLALWALGVNTMYHFALRCGGVIPLPGFDRVALCGV